MCAQLVEAVRGKGLGKLIMQGLELAAAKTSMKFIMVTVFNANAGAMKFYLEKLKYSVDETSPSRCHVDDDSTCARAPSARRAAPRRAAGV